MQAYSDLRREHDPYALSDMELFYLSAEERAEREMDCEGELWRDWLDEKEIDPAAVTDEQREEFVVEAARKLKPGWFYWFCSPGCMPDSDAYGPFETMEDAFQAARDGRDA